MTLAVSIAISLIHTACADTPSIGRFEPSMVTDHQMMELFFTPDSHADAREALGGDEDDACSWNGVRCDIPNTITFIEWLPADLILCGSLDFHRFPSHLTVLNLYEQRIYGEVDLRGIPRTMERIWLNRCLFTGTLDLGSLPTGLKELEFLGNKITAIRNFRNLPESIERIDVREAAVKQETLNIGKFPHTDLEVLLYVPEGVLVAYEDLEDMYSVDMQKLSWT